MWQAFFCCFGAFSCKTGGFGGETQRLGGKFYGSFDIFCI